MEGFLLNPPLKDMALLGGLSLSFIRQKAGLTYFPGWEFPWFFMEQLVH